METFKGKQRAVTLALLAAVLASLVFVQASTLAVADQEMLYNGNFERGFAMIPGCGQVGKGWGCFTNGGSAAYGFYDDKWEPVVADGTNAQLIEIDTKQYAASESDRYAGIFQTVRLLPGATYTLQLQGLMREANPNPAEDPFRYRVQWGYTTDGSTDWTQVDNWVELPWDKIDERTTPTGLQAFATTFDAPNSGNITLFFRAWKKWGNAYKELDVDLDAISLFGPPCKPHGGGVIVLPKPGSDHGVKVIPPTQTDNGGVIVVPAKPSDNGNGQAVVIPPYNGAPSAPAANGSAAAAPGGAQQAPVCSGTNVLKNGDFEQGFGGNGTGYYWTGFNNGLANYGYYDEQWSRVIQDGQNGQLLEINTNGLTADQTDQGRYSGIYQVVGNLVPGANYEFSFWGLMREAPVFAGEDPFRYRVQWGYAPAGITPGYGNITNWTDVPWDTIYERTDPGDMLPFSVQFNAPSQRLTIAIRAVKKWPNLDRELDVNLDAIRLVRCGQAQNGCPTFGCDQPSVVVINGGEDGTVDPPDPPPPSACVYYKIKPGDTLSGIAVRYGKTLANLTQANNIANPNRIYAGQVLCIR